MPTITSPVITHNGRAQTGAPLRRLARAALVIAYFCLGFVSYSGLLALAALPFLLARRLRLIDVGFLLVLGLAVASYLIAGAAQIMPAPLAPGAAMTRTITALLFVPPLFVMSAVDARSAIKSLALGVVVFVLVEGVMTLISAPDVALRRYMIFPVTGEEVASTGQINAAALGAGILIFLIRTTLSGWLSLLAVTFLSIAYANRTGMLLIVAFIIIWVVGNKRTDRRKAWLAFSAIVLLGIMAYAATPQVFDEWSQRAKLRVSAEGLESARYELWSYGLSQMFAGESPLGGAQLNVGTFPTYWYHNLFLDAYRVAGIPTMLLFCLLFALSFRRVRRMNAWEPLVVWVAALTLASTSVLLEGMLFEYYVITVVLAYPFITREGRTSATSLGAGVPSARVGPKKRSITP
jgi:hypothetical protein